MMFAYFLKNFEIFPLAPVIIRIIYFFTIYAIFIYIVRYSFLKLIFAYSFITFLSAKMLCILINILFLYHELCPLFLTIIIIIIIIIVVVENILVTR
jgi:hypothetical protein